MDLIVCVGDHCHLNGSEMVVTRLQELLADTGLTDRVTLKGSFCLGHCSDKGEVALRLGDQHFHTRYQDTEACFVKMLKPAIDAQSTDV